MIRLRMCICFAFVIKVYCSYRPQHFLCPSAAKLLEYLNNNLLGLQVIYVIVSNICLTGLDYPAPSSIRGLLANMVGPMVTFFSATS